MPPRTPSRRAKVSAALNRLGQAEQLKLLSLLLKAHPELQDEAEALAVKIITTVDPEAIAAEVVWAFKGFDQQEIRDRSAKDKVGGFVDPSHMQVRSDDSPLGKGGTGTAIRTGNPSVINDFLASQDSSPWHEAAVNAGYAASASFPIRCNGEVTGALVVYAATRGFFGPHEIALLEEAAGDISFALAHLELEAQRKETF